MEYRNQILIGDCRDTLRTLPDGVVHCAITSPPYWNLRSYLPDDHPDKRREIGSEETPEAFVETLVGVFREVRRVLRDDGVLFVNIGDSYDAGTSAGRKPSLSTDVGWHSKGIGRRVTSDDTKVGDLLGMPWRLAFALRDDGWFLRSDNIWWKASPMPSSQNGWRWERCKVKVSGGERGQEAYRTGACGHKPQQDHDGKNFRPSAQYAPCPGCKKCRDNDGWVLRKGRGRTTVAHEYIFMLTKSEQYFTDMEAAKEDVTGGTHSRGKKMRPPKEASQAAAGHGHGDWCILTPCQVEKRLPRSVWRLSPEPYKQAHFATFPSSLPKKCIELATSKGGCCPACGSQYAPKVTSERVPTRPAINNKIWKHQNGDAVGQRSQASPNLDPERHIQRTILHGYAATCTCNAGDPVPALVLDPFGGSGTTAQAARALGRDWIICELNEEYAALARERIEITPKWAEKPTTRKRSKRLPSQPTLFM